jgi:hypothetical protein
VKGIKLVQLVCSVLWSRFATGVSRKSVLIGSVSFWIFGSTLNVVKLAT